MITRKTITPMQLLDWMGPHMVYLTVWAALVAAAFQFLHWQWMVISWLPISLIGTAAAFYVGFKNNQAYDRLWEARKIWGGIVNDSRAVGSMIVAFVNNQFAQEPQSDAALAKAKKVLIYRHIAWLYTLRNQLLQPTEWEHVSLSGHFGSINQKRQKQLEQLGFEKGNDLQTILKKYLSTEEYLQLNTHANAATQLLANQAQAFTALRAADLIDDFRQNQLQNEINVLFAYQGQAERIKKFPLPRQYAYTSFLFIAVFIFLLPLGMVNEFAKLGEWGVWLSVPFCALVGGMYVLMELVGDYSENPFEGLVVDIPMLSLCRTIEIDLLQMIGEQDVPPAITSREGVLM